jgi:hypothetical protein
MSPLTHALVTAAHLLDELGDDSRFCRVDAYDDGRVLVQLGGSSSTERLSVLAALADRFETHIHRGVTFTASDGASTREVSVTVVRDNVPVTFWIREQVPS